MKREKKRQNKRKKKVIIFSNDDAVKEMKEKYTFERNLIKYEKKNIKSHIYVIVVK